MATEAETAVRDYMLVLKDPDSVIDQELISKLEAQIKDETDPVRRLQIRAELKAAQEADTSVYEQAFIDHAKNFADGFSIGVDAFLAENVPEDVLRRAGFKLNGAGATGSRKRKPRVSSDTIRASYPRGKKAFTVNDIAEASGASQGAVSTTIKKDVADGVLVTAGPKKDHTGPGRAPETYKRA